MAEPLRHATSEDMAAIAALCRQSIQDYDSRAKQSIITEETTHKHLYLSDYPLHEAVSRKIADYCADKGLDAMELIPEDIIYTN